MAAKCRKVDAQCRSFQESWTFDYFFKKHFGNLICLICHDSIGVNKEYNVKWHYETKHAEFIRNCVGGLEKMKFVNSQNLCSSNLPSLQRIAQKQKEIPARVTH